MANAGFSAAEEIFGEIDGLKAKESSDGASSAVAEARDEYGDTVAHDVHSKVLAPSVTYAVVGNVNALPALGSIHDWKGKKIMLTQAVVTTQAGQPPTVALSGNECEETATAKRTYAITIALVPRCKAQDVAGALTPSTKFTAITTTYAVDFVNQTVAGVVVASCATHGRTEVNATMTDGDGDGSITAKAQSGFEITAQESETAPDADYIQRTATLTKYMQGAEAPAS